MAPKALTPCSYSLCGDLMVVTGEQDYITATLPEDDLCVSLGGGSGRSLEFLEKMRLSQL